MTTFRRFCCNDLLRLAPTNIQPTNMTPDMFVYVGQLLKWPANCYVAYLPGGQVTGYIFGTIEGKGVRCSGWMSLLSLSIPDDLDLDTKLVKLLEDSCDKIYNAYTMKLLLPADDTDIIMESQNLNGFGGHWSVHSCLDELKKLGFTMFNFHQKTSNALLLGDKIEMRKPLPRLVAAAARKQEEDGN